MILLFLGIALVTVVILYIYLKDKYEKEPIKIVAISFFLGATVSIILTFTKGILHLF